MPTPRNVAQMVALPDGSALVVGGTTPAGGKPIITGAIEQFTPSNGNWAPFSGIPTQRENHASVLWKGKLYVMGGLTMEDAVHGETDLVEVMDMGTKAWTNSTRLPDKLTGLRAAVLPDDSGILIAGGFVAPFSPTSYRNDSFIFDGKTWTKTNGSLPWARSNLGLVTAPKSGQVYAVGGGNAAAA